nr:hypothetical protein [Tanacetum cinerariifolium]
MAIQGGRIQKANKKSQNAKGNGFREARKLKQGDMYLYVGNGVRAQVEAIGSFDLVLPNILVICLDNLFTDFGISVSRNNVFYFNVIPSNGIFEIDMSNPVQNVNSICNVSNKRVKHNLDSTFLWHCRLAHISKKRIEKLQKDGFLKSTDNESFDQCVSCLSRKMTRKSFPRRPERATDVVGLIHTDQLTLPYTPQHKDVSERRNRTLLHMVRSMMNLTTLPLSFSDYVLEAAACILNMVPTKKQLTLPYTPQHNDVSERRNRTLLHMVRSMMNLTTLPLSFSDYVLEAAACILNMVPTKKVDKKPYELWFGKVPNLSYLKVWGCEALVKRDTLTNFNKDLYAEFFDKNLLSQEVSGRAGDLEKIQNEDTSPSEITSEIPMEVEGFESPQKEDAHVRRSKMPHRAPGRLCLNVEVGEHSLGDLNELANYKAAMLDPESNKWLDAMNEEMQSMKDNQVWRLVDLLPNGKTVRSKWLFKEKIDMDRNVHTYKTHLVAKGFTQTYGVDYEETFSPVANIRAIRILIAIAVFYNYEIWQMDVKIAFLNGYLDDDIHMVQPEGFIDPKHSRKVCKFQRSIYGLKQESRSWNKRFDEEIKKSTDVVVVCQVGS